MTTPYIPKPSSSLTDYEPLFDPEWEFDAPRWFDFTTLTTAAIMDNNQDDLLFPGLSTPTTRTKRNRNILTPSTPMRHQIIAGFVETPSITRYFANHQATPSEMPMAFLAFGDHFSNEQVANALMADDNGYSDESILSDIHSDDDLDWNMSPVTSPHSKPTTRKSTSPTSSWKSFDDSIQADDVKKSTRRISVVFHVYPDPDCMPPVDGSVPTEQIVNAQGSSSDFNSTPTAHVLPDPPSTPVSSHHQTPQTPLQFNWPQASTNSVPPQPTTVVDLHANTGTPPQQLVPILNTPGSVNPPFPVFPQISTTETIIFSPRNPLTINHPSSTTMIKNKKKILKKPALTVPKEFSFMKRAHFPLRVISSPQISKNNSGIKQKGQSSNVPKSLKHKINGITITQPFIFRTSQRAEFRHRHESAARLQRQSSKPAEFRAHKVNQNIFQHPFMPKPSSKPTTVIDQAPHLYTSERAVHRHVFDQHTSSRLAKEAEMAEQVRLEQELELNRVVRQLRKHLVHRPRPLPKYLRK